MRALPAALLAVLLATTSARADGKFFSERVPPDLPYQRALIMFDGEREVLVLQSKYEFADEGEMRDFGWVVPVPSEPGLASMSSDLGILAFKQLSRFTQPTFRRMGEWVFYALVLTLMATLFWALGLTLVRSWRSPGRVRALKALLCLQVLAGLVILVTFLEPMSAMSGVEVVRAERVGIYDVKVVRAGDSSALGSWLRESKFSYDPEDEAGFRSYVERGWCFVAARISPGRTEGAEKFAEGLPDPLVLDFKTDCAVYPLALTALAGRETEILLYVLASHRVSADRLETLAASHGWHPPWDVRSGSEEYPAVLRDARYDLPWLTKLKGVLSPEEMREDLVLEYAESDEPYRETRYRW